MKKIISLALAAIMLTLGLTGCAGKQNDDITVISREEGSGTRGAFIELLGVEQKDESGKKVDHTVSSADISSSTAVVMTSVAGNERAIGYISLGSLNDTVKALDIDGAAASVDNIKNGSYKIARPFNIATKGDVSAVTRDFIDFILSSEGQQVVEKAGYISTASNVKAYSGTKPAGKVVVAGSSSVTPVMEKLKEAYIAINPNASIEVQMSDSTTGMTSAIDGVCDIGMASRELKSSEIEKGLKPTVIAMDGIAIIVNTKNETKGLTSTQVKDIYTGAATKWSELNG